MECFGKPVSGSLLTIIRSYKSAVTKQINAIHNTAGKRLWKRNYYEHIIHNESDLNRVREYIMYNPAQWEEDEYYEEKDHFYSRAYVVGEVKSRDRAREENRW